MARLAGSSQTITLHLHQAAQTVQKAPSHGAYLMQQINSNNKECHAVVVHIYMYDEKFSHSLTKLQLKAGCRCCFHMEK